jgi:hypothetical protein
MNRPKAARFNGLVSLVGDRQTQAGESFQMLSQCVKEGKKDA